MLARDVAMMAEADGGGAAGCRGRRFSHGGRLCPRRRAVDRAAMHPDLYYVGKLALRRKVAGDIPAICGVKTEVRRTLARIEYDCPSFEFVSHKVEWRDEVRIAGDDDKSFGCICVGVAEKRGCEIDVSSLFLNLYHMNKAISGCGALLAPGIHRWNPCLVLVVVAFNYIHAAMCGEGLKIDVLAFNRCGVVRICLCSGDEVLDGY